MIGWRKSSLLRQPITLPDSCFRFASREQIRLVENGLNYFARVLHLEMINKIVLFHIRSTFEKTNMGMLKVLICGNR